MKQTLKHFGPVEQPVTGEPFGGHGRFFLGHWATGSRCWAYPATGGMFRYAGVELARRAVTSGGFGRRQRPSVCYDWTSPSGCVSGAGAVGWPSLSPSVVIVMAPSVAGRLDWPVKGRLTFQRRSPPWVLGGHGAAW